VRRRQLLRTAAMLPLLPGGLAALLAPMKALRKLVPNAGSYVSESNYFNPQHHGVGSEDWSDDGFTRLA
jgi:hypothetical protein